MSNSNTAKQRLVAVSNRLPFSLEREEHQWIVHPGSGGLISAMVPVLRNRDGLWIGWSGTSGDYDWDEILKNAKVETGYNLHPVSLTEEEVDKFYNGFSNQVVWPLFHDLQTRCNFDLEFWNYYRAVNDKFADVICKASNENDFLWVHDYHLMHVAKAIKARGVNRRTGFFLHIPFPVADIFVKMPWRSGILRGLLEFDLIGFQTQRDRRHFIHCLEYLIKDVVVEGEGAVLTVRVGDRTVRIGNFPIGIDFDAFAKPAASDDVSERVRTLQDSMDGAQIILCVDRLDYTKGIPERLRAFKYALEHYPELHRRVTMVQVVVPSRTGVGQYRSLKAEIEQLVGEINGKFTYHSWVPIHHMYRSLNRDELIAHYRAAHIGLITPLKDGMNLVCKEYCASHVKDDGALILSEFAGSAAQFQGKAILVNPHDVKGVADAIHTAFKMDIGEKIRRMTEMRRIVKEHNIFWWVDSFLRASVEKKLQDFPTMREYVPVMDEETAAEV